MSNLTEEICKHKNSILNRPFADLTNQLKNSKPNQDAVLQYPRGSGCTSGTLYWFERNLKHIETVVYIHGGLQARSMRPSVSEWLLERISIISIHSFTMDRMRGRKIPTYLVLDCIQNTYQYEIGEILHRYSINGTKIIRINC